MLVVAIPEFSQEPVTHHVIDSDFVEDSHGGLVEDALRVELAAWCT